MKDLTINCVMELIISIFLHIFFQLIKHPHGFVSQNFVSLFFSYLHDYLLLAQQDTFNDNQNTPREIRFLQPNRASTAHGQLYNDHYASHQQMEAENRLQQLEVIRPKENINLLNVKYRHVQHPRHARPILPQYRDDYVNTFYDQMGSYVQERAGLYHTENYDPRLLPQAMPELENQQGIISTSTNENNLDDLLNRTEQNQNRTKPKLFQYRAIGDYGNMRVSL